MTGLAVLTLIAAPASPVPAVPPAPAAAGKVDPNQAQQFARLVYNLADQVAAAYVVEKKDHVRELIDGAVRGLYDEAGQAVPDAVKAAVARAEGTTQLIEVLTDARVLLGNHPNLAGARSLFAAMNGFKHATDPSNGLYSPRINTYASVDHDFNVGLELEGAVGTRWAIYQVEHGVATRRYAAVGWFGPVPQPDAVPSPAGFPWKVRRVVPGSPAQQKGVKPGDTITHLNGTEITAENANKLFAQFSSPGQAFDPNRRPVAADRVLTFRRGDEKPFTATLKADGYSPESAFGVVRTPEDKWDCMLDRKYKIGYIRLGPIEQNLDTKVADMVGDLEKRGCRALILDLRWCPGGYVTPGTNIAGLFLKGDTMIAKTEARNPARLSTPPEIRTAPGGGQFSSLMMVVLVGQETTGGGELIACALRDNGRCVVIGQRTVGRASIQTPIPAGFPPEQVGSDQVQFRVTAGVSYRPNGKPRQRLPDSQPLDDWGVKPDAGLEVPITADKSAELRRQAEMHSLRPADGREALPFDDPDADPYRLMALTYLRKQLGPPPEPKK